ncbi:MAG: GH3 auxin-responsive promoter family protein [Muribaculaceae bacterium]|nr:GH3 auxin-responsive promoter family protein [Muribaculaceae bacterium]
MIDFTPIVRPYFARRVRASKRWIAEGEQEQRRQLAWLVGAARKTLWGERFGYSGIRRYEDFALRVPVTPYESLRPYVERMIAGERDILWPGKTLNFAQSSGTSDGKSKYIPITADSFRRCHYQGGSDVVAHYLNLYPDSRMFSGKGFILGGSYANELDLRGGVRVGDLSANLIDNINPVVNMVRVPSKRVALMEDWLRKLPALVDASVGENITNISGVPSWFLTVIREVLKRTGTSCIHDVWPNLEVFFHGGISFAPYREQYRAITDTSRMRYLETYNASEGFFAVQNAIDDPGMLMLLDAGVFYEFMPLDELGSETPELLPIWSVEPGKIYALVITACNGLWRYPLGDTVKIESVDPVKVTIAGRTKHYINAFGEELMVHNADAALEKACKEMGCSVSNYTAAPVYAENGNRGRHEWLIEFSCHPQDVDAFAERLDGLLQQENSDYQAKRYKGIFLDRLSIVVARQGVFDDWLGRTGKLGGQRKVPRLSNDRRFIDPLLELNKNKQ